MCVCFGAHVYLRLRARIHEAKRAGQRNLSAGSLSTWRVDKGGDWRIDITTDQISFSRRNAVKGNCVAASSPGISTPKKHGEMKGDMEICSDTAVSPQTRCHERMLIYVGTHAYTHFPTGFHTYTIHVHAHKHIPEPDASSASYPLQALLLIRIVF